MKANIVVWKIPINEQDAPVQGLLNATTLDDAARKMPGGAYTTFRTFERRWVLRLGEHFQRLEETAQLAGFHVKLNRQRIRAALRHAIEMFQAPELRIRITLDLEQDSGVIYLTLEALHVPSTEDYTRGVGVVTVVMRRQNPKAKLTSFIETASHVREHLPAGVNEGLMVSEDGLVLEGLSSNFFAVRAGILWTAEQGVLSGITREQVFAAAHQLGIPVRLEAVPAAELPAIDEAFITSASRAVLPVTIIDDRPVGDGNPGELTQRLSDAYQAMLSAALEEI